ncbi:hypothetical protein BJ508DRAFT_333337 [Ascobolus immersus RN42]|uniref:Uncharacterized protein n=1 Tax=Ascobolus immersus RN42 TaxID=1160509 RepID=A0A3N4HWW8_ASCIM|nr:hypothetical protein BJ508DRAFT_333337 [Ascobolus immersus RN42]
MAKASESLIPIRQYLFVNTSQRKKKLILFNTTEPGSNPRIRSEDNIAYVVEPFESEGEQIGHDELEGPPEVQTEINPQQNDTPPEVDNPVFEHTEQEYEGSGEDEDDIENENFSQDSQDSEVTIGGDAISARDDVDFSETEDEEEQPRQQPPQQPAQPPSQPAARDRQPPRSNKVTAPRPLSPHPQTSVKKIVQPITNANDRPRRNTNKGEVSTTAAAPQAKPAQKVRQQQQKQQPQQQEVEQSRRRRRASGSDKRQ